LASGEELLPDARIMKINFQKLSLSMLVVFLCWGAVRPIFHNGFFPMHDDTQPARVYEMAKALSYGQFPVRWVPDLGYGFGYPLFNFYAPLPYYVGSIVYLAGFDAITATKIMFIIGILLAGIIMYFLGREIGGDISGLVSAVLYMYAPYHAVNIYVRGAVGELYAYAFLPLIFLGILKIFKSIQDQKNFRLYLSKLRIGILTGSIGIAAVALSHNILGMLSGIFIAVWLVIYLIHLFFGKQKLFIIYYLLFALLLGIGLSAFFTIPALMEKKYTRVEELTTRGSDFRMHFVYSDQLWNSSWGFAGSALGRKDGMSFKIGKFHLVLGSISLLSAFYFYKKRRINHFQFSIFIFQFLLFLISVFMMLGISIFIWEKIPIFAYIQYPWRFLNYTVFSLSVLAGFIFIPLKKPLQIILAVPIIIATLWLNLKYFVPKEFNQVLVEDYTSGINLRYKISKISDEYTPKYLHLPGSAEEVVWQGISETGDYKIITSSETPVKKSYQLLSYRQASIVTNIAFFPGWQALLDGQKIKTLNSQGRILVNIPAGQHKLELILSDSPVRRFANTISLFSLVLLVYVSLFKEKNSSWVRKLLLR